MQSKTVPLPTVSATIALGAALATEIREGLVYLQGALGTGKTTLVRGWLQALGHAGAVTSPTYTLIEPYSLNGIEILHIDLYRIEKSVEIDYIGLLEQLELSHLQLVEWPEQGRERLPDPDVVIQLTTEGSGRSADIRYFNDQKTAL